MMIINSKTGCMASGIVTRDAEYKTVGNKLTPLLKFGIRYGSEVDAGGERQGKFIDVDVWGNQAISLRGLISKGDCVLVLGELQSREYNGKTYHSIRTDGEVFPCGSWIVGLLETAQQAAAITAGTAPIVSAPNETAENFAIIEDGDDLPF